MQTVTPAQFRRTHGDITTWDSIEFDIYEHLIEAESRPLPEPPTAGAERPRHRLGDRGRGGAR
ncbi:hypothetical protein DFJ69_6400 [Thermomonospora umbrina]|uniref:Uncharacterized protein n=1 Tax=Thermomonospora umbrina TaxID=111806 RepID=A0A3D9SZ10_9ACTN|nr:hypothetical protein DFJ69_6400 [Thermomonospora umbrina]